MLELTASHLRREGLEVHADPVGPVREALHAFLDGAGPPGLVILGKFGSGKTTLCEAAAANGSACTVVPLRVVARHDSLEAGLTRVAGPAALAEARDGRRVLLLDGLDEVAHSEALDFPSLFDELTALAGPRWVLTSRPGHFRTDASDPEPRQVDVLTRPDVVVLRIDDLTPDVVRREVSGLPNGARLLESVEGLEQLSASPLLLQVVHAAVPFIDSGRPIQPWGVFDAWVRYALQSGPGHADHLHALETIAWVAYKESGYTSESASFRPEDVERLHLPPSLASLFVQDLDGRLRFGHRSLYEFFVAAHLSPRIAANQDQGPDELSGRRLTEAMRVFLTGRVAPMPVVYQNGRVRIPRGNFVAGGDDSADERPLRIHHLARPVWIAREPVTNADWARFLEATPEADRVDVHYLAHWGAGHTLPKLRGGEPVYNVWPEDADRYAAWAKARLPSADEWEKAVRGLDGRRWPWSDWWKLGHAVTAETGVRRPLPARAMGAHGEAGLFGAIGGVFEYTSSPYRDRPERGRVVMGGCYTHPYPTSRASLRLSHKLSGNLKAGLRLAWDAE